MQSLEGVRPPLSTPAIPMDENQNKGQMFAAKGVEFSELERR